MTQTGMRRASEAGLISQILLQLSSDARRERAQAARARRQAKPGGGAAERTREALRDLDQRGRSPVREH